MGFLPGKRESRRYVGDYILKQSDLSTAAPFGDVVGYGGWSMDDHNPKGFETKEPPTIYHPVKSPYGIPFRCLYSVNIQNLMFAGRNISATHTAMASTRVMATCGVLGQAVGTAAALAVKEKLTPRQVYSQRITLLQRQLMEDDCYLPGLLLTKSEFMDTVTITSEDGNTEYLTDGCERTTDGEEHLWKAPLGTEITAVLDEEKRWRRLLLFSTAISTGIPGGRNWMHTEDIR